VSTQTILQRAKEAEQADVVLLVEAVRDGTLTDPAEIAKRCEAVEITVDDLESLVNDETERRKAEKFRTEADTLDQARPTLERDHKRREAERGAADRKHQAAMGKFNEGIQGVADQITKSRERSEQCRTYATRVLRETPVLNVAVQLVKLRKSRLPLVERSNTLTERLKATASGSDEANRITTELQETERALAQIDARISHLTPTV
jgi:hypothetical protein